jgi:hypothetical protein
MRAVVLSVERANRGTGGGAGSVQCFFGTVTAGIPDRVFSGVRTQFAMNLFLVLFLEVERGTSASGLLI